MAIDVSLSLCKDIANAANIQIGYTYPCSVAGEEVAGVDFGGYVGEFGSGAVGQDGVRAGFEFGQVVDHHAAEKCRAVG